VKNTYRELGHDLPIRRDGIHVSGVLSSDGLNPFDIILPWDIVSPPPIHELDADISVNSGAATVVPATKD
jgi:hypothetical protein